MNRAQITLVMLTVIGCLSPLLTFAALFQQKEWRADRLIEHLKREGFFNQLFGKIRPLLVAMFILADVVGIAGVYDAIQKGGAMNGIEPFVAVIHIHTAFVWLFATLTVAQLLMRKQRTPVWTTKALTITAVSIALVLGISLIVTPYIIFTPFLYVIQPFVVWTAWTVTFPIDFGLKRQTFRRARDVRESMEGATVIGIAGSVGKTTTKELLKCVLQDLHPLTTPDHVNTEMGVAQWMIRHGSKLLATNNQLLIIEMGAYRTGEIELMCNFTKPTIGVMTAIGSDHLALFGSEQAIVDANAELLKALPDNGHAFLYADNDATRNMEVLSHASVTLAGIHDRATVRADRVEQTKEGLRITVQSETYDVALHGIHNVGNVLLAVAIAKHLGISTERIQAHLRSFQPLKHTFSVHEDRGITIVDDTYNSSRLSVRAALHWAGHRTERPRVLLLSELLETGTHEDRFLEELGKEAKESVDRIVIIDAKMKAAFERGYGSAVELLNRSSQPLTTGALLLCIGRMHRASIEKLLP